MSAVRNVCPRCGDPSRTSALLAAVAGLFRRRSHLCADCRQAAKQWRVRQAKRDQKRYVASVQRWTADRLRDGFNDRLAALPMGSDDEAALLAAIRATPADDLPRLVYADWLEDHGLPELGQHVRALTTGQPSPVPDAEWMPDGFEGEAGGAEVVRKRMPAAVRTVAGGYDRGVFTAAWGNPVGILAAGDDLFRCVAVGSASLVGYPSRLARTVAALLDAGVTDLAFRFEDTDSHPAFVAALTAAPARPGVTYSVSIGPFYGYRSMSRRDQDRIRAWNPAVRFE